MKELNKSSPKNSSSSETFERSWIFWTKSLTTAIILSECSLTFLKHFSTNQCCILVNTLSSPSQHCSAFSWLENTTEYLNGIQTFLWRFQCQLDQVQFEFHSMTAATVTLGVGKEILRRLHSLCRQQSSCELAEDVKFWQMQKIYLSHCWQIMIKFWIFWEKN